MNQRGGPAALTPGFHDGGAKNDPAPHGTLPANDETPPAVVHPRNGGLRPSWGLEPELLTVGKSIAGGGAAWA